MKTIFRNLKTFALVVLAGAATLAVSCEPVDEPTPGGVETLVFQLEGNDVFFAAGESKTIGLSSRQTVEGATINAPEGWTVVASAAGLEITAPAQASIDEGAAETAGKVEISVKVSNKVYEGVLYVFVGDSIVYVEATSATFNDIQVKAVIKGVDKYMIHLGTEGAWKVSFDEWQNPNPMLPEAPLFGWEGEYYETSFEGSLFTFANDPYAVNFMAMPGVTYDVAILPIVEGKALADYSYSDVYLYAFKTAAAGENGKVTPKFTLAEQTHNSVSVNVSAEDAYVTFWTYYKAAEYEEIGGREKVIKNDLIINGDQSTEANFVAKKTGLAQGEKLYIAALSLDKSGNYGALVVEEVYSGVYPFNDIEVTIGEVSHSSDGKTVYVPVTTKGGEVAYYRYAYISSGGSEWSITYGGSIEKAEVYVASVPNQYYGPKFVQPDELVDGKIVITRGVVPGIMARILVVATDADGNSSHAAYVEYTSTEAQYQVLYKNDAGYEYGMPNVSFKNVTSETLQDGTVKYWVNFNVDLVAETDAAWVCVAGEEYTNGRTPYQLLFSPDAGMIAGNFMFSREFTEDGVFNADSMYCSNEETRSAVYVAWRDDNGIYHETNLMYKPVEDAQPHLPK